LNHDVVYPTDADYDSLTKKSTVTFEVIAPKMFPGSNPRGIDDLVKPSDECFENVYMD